VYLERSGEALLTLATGLKWNEINDHMATGMNESMKEWTTLGKPWVEMLNPILELHSGWGFLPG